MTTPRRSFFGSILAAIGLGPLVAREVLAGDLSSIPSGLTSIPSERISTIGVQGWSRGRLTPPVPRLAPSEAINLNVGVSVQPAIDELKRFEEAVASATRAIAAFNVEADKLKAYERNPAMIARDALARAGYDLDEPSFVEAARELDRTL